MTADDFPVDHRSKASLKVQAVATLSSAGGITLNIQSAFANAVYIRLALYPNSRATQKPRYLGIRVLHPGTPVLVELTAEQASMWLQTAAAKRSPTPSLRIETSHDPREWAIVVPPRLADASLPQANDVD
ncbi:hypothetical protein FOL47_002553 [Perkinsus chesapeaki]|uniref:Uncharacterized protein n=1 Tax=Perkinsus chesapeaki TaxID=330153 RepID=A0A7J6KPC2_PERCH|nr:hypothetical protein FOL47_002553 [Perkinsus chesapeaki]